MGRVSPTIQLAGLAAAISCFAGPAVSSASEFDGGIRVWNEFKLTEYSKDEWTTFTWAELRFIDDAS